MDDSGEADDERCLNAGGTEEVGAGEVCNVMSDLKEALGTCTPGMHHSFWDPFTSEVLNFLHQVIIF